MKALHRLHCNPPRLEAKYQLKVMAILQLAAWHANNYPWKTTQTEMAAKLGVHVRTLQRYLPMAVATGRISIKREAHQIVVEMVGLTGVQPVRTSVRQLVATTRDSVTERDMSRRHAGNRAPQLVASDRTQQLVANPEQLSASDTTTSCRPLIRQLAVAVDTTVPRSEVTRKEIKSSKSDVADDDEWAAGNLTSTADVGSLTLADVNDDVWVGGEYGAVTAEGVFIDEVSNWGPLQ